MLLTILKIILTILIIIGIVKLIRSKNKTHRIIGKVFIGLLLVPFVILVLLFLTCLVIINFGS